VGLEERHSALQEVVVQLGTGAAVEKARLGERHIHRIGKPLCLRLKRSHDWTVAPDGEKSLGALRTDEIRENPGGGVSVAGCGGPRRSLQSAEARCTSIDGRDCGTISSNELGQTSGGYVWQSYRGPQPGKTFETGPRVGQKEAAAAALYGFQGK